MLLKDEEKTSGGCKQRAHNVRHVVCSWGAMLSGVRCSRTGSRADTCLSTACPEIYCFGSCSTGTSVHQEKIHPWNLFFFFSFFHGSFTGRVSTWRVLQPKQFCRARHRLIIVLSSRISFDAPGPYGAPTSAQSRDVLRIAEKAERNE